MARKSIQTSTVIFVSATFGSDMQQEFFEKALESALKALASFSQGKHKNNDITIQIGERLVFCDAEDEKGNEEA